MFEIYPTEGDSVSKTKQPMLASAASQMESTSLPLRELRKRYTASEMFVMAWRSNEIAHNMGETVGPRKQPSAREVADGIMTAIDDKQVDGLERSIGDLGDRLTGKDGEVHLHQLKGKEVLRVLSALGIHGRA